MDPDATEEFPPSDISSSSQSTLPASSTNLPSEEASSETPPTTAGAGSSSEDSHGIVSNLAHSVPPATSDQSSLAHKVDHKPDSDGVDSEEQPSPPVLDTRTETSRYQLVFGLDDTNTSSETSLSDSPRLSGANADSSDPSPPAAPASLEEGRFGTVAIVSSQPPVPDSDLSATSEGMERNHADVSAADSGSSPLLLSSSVRPDGKVQKEEEMKEKEGKGQKLSEPNNQSIVQSESMLQERDGNEAIESASGKGSSHVSSTHQGDTGDTQTGSPDASSRELNSVLPPGSEGKILQPRSASSAVDPSLATSRSDQVVHIDDISLHSRSTSPLEEVKVHPLSVLTSDSEAEEDPVRPRKHSQPTYSRITPTSDEDQATQGSSEEPFPTVSPTSSLLSSESEEANNTLFNNISYLGSSTVDAPVSEIEANRKMHILKEQAAGTEPIPVTLSIPQINVGSVILKDPKTQQPMAAYPIRQILFCARGNAEVLLDCFCLNVRARRSGMYQCHVFRCDHNQECDRVFKAIGKAFNTKTLNKESPPSDSTLLKEFQVSLDIMEEDSKGVFTPVHMDKDCFKLRLQARRKLILYVSQPTSDKPLLISKCFGMLMCAGKDSKDTEMNLLDNMSPSPNGGPSFSVTGIWEQDVDFLSSLNEETPRSMRYQYLTVAADLILEGVSQPVRFRREVKVHVSKGGMAGFSAGTILNQFTYKKKPGPMDQMLCTLRLTKNEENGEYVVTSLMPNIKLRQQGSVDGGSGVGGARSLDESHRRTPSPSRLGRSGSLMGSKQEHAPRGGTPTAGSPKNQEEESDNDEEDDTVVSGWGDVEGMNEEMLKDWGEVLERWDGRDRVRPSKVVKLCRKGIPRHMRCQVWQMLTGAAHDPQLAEAYRLLLVKESPAENVINWDIKRTYVGHGYFQEEDNKAALYKISKAYSIYDEEVGYCQGFSFMAAVLLLQKMPEETAFSVLVKIMYNYGHRNLFKANFQDLHMMFFQLEKLMEENLPDLYDHMTKNRIETHMYASQWFLTLYTAKFPLSIVFRILDVYLCERIGVIFQVALALLKIAKKDLLALDFEGILNYFRVSLPKKFQTEEDCQLLFRSMANFKVSEKKLAKLERDYQQHLEQQAQLEDPVFRLEKENKQLRDNIYRLEQENDNLAEDLVGSKIKLRSEMDKLEERIDMLSKECRSHKAAKDEAQSIIHDLREELKQAKEEFQRLMIKLTEERQQHDGAIEEYKQVFRKLDEGHQKQKEDLNRELLEVKAQLGGTEEAATSSLSSEQRLRNLELELAQTKLALVESQCKNQELEHKIVELNSSKRRPWDFGKKK